MKRKGIETYLHGPMDCVKTLKLQFGAGDLDLPERRNRCINTQSGGGRRCADSSALLATLKESRTHTERECGRHNLDRDVFEMRIVDECDMDKFSRLDVSEKTIGILGDRWWPQKGKQDGEKRIYLPVDKVTVSVDEGTGKSVFIGRDN